LQKNWKPATYDIAPLQFHCKNEPKQVILIYLLENVRNPLPLPGFYYVLPRYRPSG